MRACCGRELEGAWRAGTSTSRISAPLSVFASSSMAGFWPAVKPPRWTMLKHLLIGLVGHVSGLSDAQLGQIEKSLPATKDLIDLLVKAQPIIEQAQKLYVEAEPLIDEAMKELQTVGPAAQILVDAIGHHLNHG